MEQWTANGDLQQAFNRCRGGRKGWRHWGLGVLSVGMLGASWAGRAHAAPLPVVDNVDPLCGAEEVVGNPLSPHRAEVAVRVWLTNTDPAVATNSSVQVTLHGGGAVPASPVQQAALAGGQATLLTFWFPIPSVSGTAAVEVRVEDLDGGFVVVDRRALSFACVPAPSADNVILRLEQMGPCPTVNGWENGRAGRMVAQLPSVPGVSPGRTYCAYVWTNPGEPQLSWFDRLIVPVNMTWEVDAPVVAPLAIPLEEVALATDLRLGVDQLSLALAQLPNAPAKVWLGVIDTAAKAFGDRKPDNGDHGRRVGLIARRTACGAHEQCPVQIHNELALPVTEADYAEDLVRGGYFGTRGHVAHALRRLVDGWESSRSTNPLVINLSFGWHSKHDCNVPGCRAPLQFDLPSTVLVPDVLGYLPSDGSPYGQAHSLGSEAVVIELTRARCLGAMVLAAAGNAVGNDNQGPLSPAGWNELEVTASRCDELDISRTSGPAALVEAVGAVGFEGQPSAITRQGSLPRFVALGVGLTVEDPLRPLPNTTTLLPMAVAGVDPLTLGGKVLGALPRREVVTKTWLDPASGTSLATAVVSGAAARLWAQLGSHHTAEDVLNELYKEATPVLDTPPLVGLGLPAGAEGFLKQLAAKTLLADLYPLSHSYFPGPEVREVNACTALSALGLSASGIDCQVDPVAGASLVQQRKGLVRVEGATCGLPGQAPCPRQLAAIDQYEAPWAVPQPWGITCATCTEYLSARGKGTDYDIVLDLATLKRLSGTDAFDSVWIKAGSTSIPVDATLIKSNVLRGNLFFYAAGHAPASLLILSRSTLSTGVLTETETALIRGMGW